MSGAKQKNVYQDELLNEFSKIYSDLGDGCPTNSLLSDVQNRQQILFMQYQMEKRGKNLGMSQSRLFKIEQGRLYQVDDSSQEKELPLPTSISMVKRENQQWQSKYQLCKAKIVLRFAQRSDITLYFKETIEWRQIGMYLNAQIRKQKDKFLNQLAKKFRLGVVEQMVNSIRKIKQSSTDLRVLRNKTRVNDIFKHKLSDKALFGQLLDKWKSTVLFKRRQIVLKIGLIELKISNPINGQIKLWTRGTVSNQLSLTSDKAVKCNKQFQYKFANKFAETYKTLLSDDQVQFQIECKGMTYKSERFTPCDLCKVANQCKFIQLNLISKEQAALLKISIQIKGITPVQSHIQITPKHYRVIDELYVTEGKRFFANQIHPFYLNELRNAQENRCFYLSFNRCKQLFQLLRIQQLIDKFYLVSPFKDYVNVNCKGTIIYQYFTKDYNQHLFYDVEKIMWKHSKYQYRRILHALKSFDQNPKFNFTQPFLFIVQRMYGLALNQTINRWRQNLFSKDILGIETITFFLSLAVVKLFSSLFVQQEFVNKRSLPFNSLLFIFIHQKHQSDIHNKLLKIQLNIEAYFGKHIISLFSQLFSGDLFNKILLLLIEQRQKDMQNVYIVGLVSIFLSLTEIVDKYSCAYASAEHYMITFEQLCKEIPQKLQFFIAIKKWQKIVTEQLESAEFKSLATDMTEFYLNNFYSGELGQISRQIYQQFICYHYKNEMDLRKIFIMIDKIQISQPSAQLTLCIFQSATKIYEHNFKGVNLNQLEHFIELKLTKLEELNIICNNGKYSFSCRLDPKEIPSNLYFHLVKPLILTYHMSPECNRHIFLQVYIKDNCEIQSLQNPIPVKYRQILLEKKVNKQDIIFCKKFTKSFRMRQNNFNLLYSKLGWFGNHYLFPDDRFINFQIIGPKRANQQQIYNRLLALDRFTRSIYGRAILPHPTNQTRSMNIQMIKQGVLVNYQPLGSPTHINDVHLYSSASRLACYCLDNFNIPTSMQFLQFYHQMIQKLPLIEYLSYQPKLYYYLPSFTFQVYNTLSTSTVLITEKGNQFITEFSQTQIVQIQQKAAFFTKIPTQMQFCYTNKPMLFDQFLYFLRLNILKRVSQSDAKKQLKGKKWLNSLISSTVNIPNYELRHFYQVMNQTKQIIQFEFKETNTKLQPKIEYCQFALINNRWTKVYCIAELKATTKKYFYVLQQLERKKHIIEEKQFIKTSSQPFKSVELSDEIENSMQVVSYQLSKMFNK